MLLELFAQTDPPKMGAGDNFWFFFSGHGIRHNDRDYLMPSDGHPADIEDTAIPINFVSERLRRCGADNVVLILDACRSQLEFRLKALHLLTPYLNRLVQECCALLVM